MIFLVVAGSPPFRSHTKISVRSRLVRVRQFKLSIHTRYGDRHIAPGTKVFRPFERVKPVGAAAKLDLPGVVG